MKRTLILIFTLMALAGAKGFAQGQFRKPLKSTRQSIQGFSNYNVGLKVGCPWSYMQKLALKETTYNGNFGYLAGIFLERNLGRWSVGLESTFAQKGSKMHNEKEYEISLANFGILKTTYSVAYHVVTVRVPVSYYFKGMIKDDKVIPYVFVGPEFDIPLDTMVESVTQRFDGPNGDNPLPEKKEAFKPIPNLSAVAGLGLMTKLRFENFSLILKFDAAFNYGILNLASKEKRWSQTEGIHAHDVEVNFSVVYPIKKILHDACHNLQ
ncbi:MAG: outer membrane beta-barrel protein [Bacteroidales bacterium]|nr:outer membrane beta-barrel protein [Bacteroidales bacterium]